MKPIAYALIAVASLAAPAAWAQGKVLGPSPSSRGVLDLFEQPGGQPSRQIKAGEAGLPLPIEGSQAGYHAVTIEGHKYWLRSAQVRIERQAAASCAGAADTPQRTGSTPGAGENPCK